MTNFLFVNGQVKALESRLLTPNRLERMAGAPNAEDAFRVMVELQYAEYFDDTTKPQDFGTVIQQGLRETKDMIQKGGDYHPGYDIFFSQFDINNLKQAFHQKLTEKKGPLTEKEFIEDYGYSLLSNLTLQELNKVVFEGKSVETLPEIFIDVASRAEGIYNEKGHFRFVEYAFDQAFGSYITEMAQSTRNSFLKEFTRMLVDSINIRSLGRSILLHSEPLDKEAFIPAGTLAEEDLTKVNTVELLQVKLGQTGFIECVNVLKEDASSGEKMQAYEYAIDKRIQLFLESAASDDIASIAVSLNYFERRLRDARRLRFVMYAKFNGLSTDFIHKTLETL